ncbi:hypothetical protein [Roseateles sp.]|uniref:hypothetical protein n=1 Tax=Roseateles sp. TaxID=1971397 RepID=UPI0031CDDE11
MPAEQVFEWKEALTAASVVIEFVKAGALWPLSCLTFLIMYRKHLGRLILSLAKLARNGKVESFAGIKFAADVQAVVARTGTQLADEAAKVAELPADSPARPASVAKVEALSESLRSLSDLATASVFRGAFHEHAHERTQAPSHHRDLADGIGAIRYAIDRIGPEKAAEMDEAALKKAIESIITGATPYTSKAWGAMNKATLIDASGLTRNGLVIARVLAKEKASSPSSPSPSQP